MVGEEDWKHIYNSVFSIYLPPDEIIDKIILKTDDEKKEFKSSTELLTYLALNMSTTVTQKNVKFFLRDNTIYKENQKCFEDLCRKMKKVV